MTPSQLLGFARPASTPRSAAITIVDFSAFRQQLESECTHGSAIAPELFQAAIALVSDTETFAGGDVAYPIHEALNWHVTRFGYQARETLYAALFLNEDGSTWQAKLSQPRADAKGKAQKYETPVGNGAKAYLPPVPPDIRQRLAERYGIYVPLDGDFWTWFEQHPEIPLTVTEGGKKGLAGFSQGFVTIALYGCNGGYRTKDVLGQPIAPTLIPDLARFAVSGRPIILAFDEDDTEKTRRQVTIAQARFGSLLAAKGCDVAIARWHSQQGKGLDDLIVNAGATAWEAAAANALPFNQWQILQRLERQLTVPINLRVNLGDLAQLDPAQLPSEGMIALCSPKGTGKTKLIAALLAHQERVLSLTHRIALGRNLCTRTGLYYRGDLDKLKGQYIHASGYTLRIGSCVDGLLSLDPNQFAGGDLVLDEAVQLVRHLLTSSTCARDGKRPALLARFRALVKNAKRVLLADADLDNATLHYLQSLRGDNAPVFLVKNDFEPAPYACRLLAAPDRTAITGALLGEIAQLPPGKVLFVATDSKATSKALHRLITQQQPKKRVLLLNSETTGGECEREFLQTPDTVLERGDYDLILCSPSVATGVSIECRGVIAAVYGIFTGVSATDADMSQSLSRVREPVERVVWCAKTGSNYAKVSLSVNPLEVRSHLQSQTTATIQLLRSSLKEDILAGVDAIDWRSDPHLGLYCQLAAAQNYSMRCLREALLTRLRFEGNTLTIEDRGSDPALRALLAQTRAELQLLEAEALVTTETLTYTEVVALEQKESLSPEEHLAIAKWHLLDFYDLETLTVDDCLWDSNGRRRGELLGLEALLFPTVAFDRTARALEKQATWNQGFCPWDIAHAPLRRWLLVEIGIDKLLARLRDGWQWCRYDLKPYADRARALAAQVKVALHFTIRESMSDTQVIHQLLSQLGIKLTMCWSRSFVGYEGQKLRTYTLDTEHWGKLSAVLERREAKRQRLQAKLVEGDVVGSPVVFELVKDVGDPPEDVVAWLLPAVLADVQNLVLQAGDDPEVLASLRRAIPEYVLRHLGVIG
ncbi:plasmid replication protein, CyRepA1 family [Stenomitos frigidus]|nr:plasmid replication protein, CyRepA1 family [Stenomitos frigidus]